MKKADLTTVPDFRVLAHEIGHVLNLKHTDQSRARLMYQGANGFDLALDEIKTAREAIKSL